MADRDITDITDLISALDMRSAVRVADAVIAARAKSGASRAKIAFVLIRYEGLSIQDAAQVLGATPTAVKLRAFRAYEALRAELEELKREAPARAGAARARAEGGADGRS